MQLRRISRDERMISLGPPASSIMLTLSGRWSALDNEGAGESLACASNGEHRDIRPVNAFIPLH